MEVGVCGMQRDDIEAARRYAADVKDVQQRTVVLSERVAQLQEEAEEIRNHPTVRGLEEVLVRLDSIYEEQYGLVSAALAWRHTPADVREWVDRAMFLGARRQRFGPTLLGHLMYLRKVPNTPLRLFLEGRNADNGRRTEDLDDTYATEDYVTECASAVGTDKRTFCKELGMYAKVERTHKSVKLFIPYEFAATLVRTLGMKPRDAGI